jgi:hypothetical protein
MIEPGKETLELFLNNPQLYFFWIYVIPLILAGATAYFADRAADEKLKRDTQAANPEADLNEVFEFEHVGDPIAWGILACVVMVFPMVRTLDAVGDWTAVWAAAVLSGMVARAGLMKLASSFMTKVTEVKG